MTAMFIITSKNKTTQSLWSHSCLQPFWMRNNGGLMTAHSNTVATVNQQLWEGLGLGDMSKY